MQAPWTRLRPERVPQRVDVTMEGHSRLRLPQQVGAKMEEHSEAALRGLLEAAGVSAEVREVFVAIGCVFVEECFLLRRRGREATGGGPTTEVRGPFFRDFVCALAW